MAEAAKEKKDRRKAKKADKERAKLRRGTRWQGSEEEEESDDDEENVDDDEEEGGIGGLSSAEWAQFEQEDDNTSLAATGPFPFHTSGQEEGGVPSEATHVQPALSGPPERREDSAPPRPIEARLGSALPEATEAGCPAPSGSPDPRESSKRPRAEEVQPGSVEPAPKRVHMVSSR